MKNEASTAFRLSDFKRLVMLRLKVMYMKKSWLYKQKYYSNSAWNEFQRILAFEIIPFIVCAVIAVGVVLVLFSPFLLMVRAT